MDELLETIRVLTERIEKLELQVYNLQRQIDQLNPPLYPSQPSYPYVPLYPTLPYPYGGTRCGTCGVDFGNNPMGYVCGRSDCPTKVTCKF